MKVDLLFVLIVVVCVSCLFGKFVCGVKSVGLFILCQRLLVRFCRLFVVCCHLLLLLVVCMAWSSFVCIKDYA